MLALAEHRPARPLSDQWSKEVSNETVQRLIDQARRSLRAEALVQERRRAA